MKEYIPKHRNISIIGDFDGTLIPDKDLEENAIDLTGQVTDVISDNKSKNNF